MAEQNNEEYQASAKPLYYVGIGASAGGLEALEAFFTNMPADSGLAFIVIQHLSPDYKSLMVELLSKRTGMPVRRAEEAMWVEPNTVYLIPPRKLLTIFHGKLILTDLDHSKGINMPIDAFLRSLAEDQGEKVIGIILSGTGSDGVRGIRAIKEAGGMVMVQSQESAKFDGMPRAAIDTGLTDVELPPEEMPSRLLGFLRRPFAVVADRPHALLSDEDGLTRIFALLREQTRVDFTFYKPSTVLRRIERRISVCQMTDLRDYVRLLESRPSEVSTLYRELLIGVTSFFRDREVFDEIANLYLPELLKQGNNREEIRFWVAGCSSGEEAYTLAILAQECMDRLQRSIPLKIFATDIDREAIQRAGSGIYPESIAADLPPGVLSKYFVRRENQYQVQRGIREMVVFAQHNLIKDPPFTNIDLVSCRNLLIYLQPVLQQKVLESINFSLTPQGLLLLGTSETPGEMTDFFAPLHNKFKIYRSQGKKRLVPDAKLLFQPVIDSGVQYTPNRRTRGFSNLSHREEERLLERLLDTLAEDYIPLVAVVNENMELVHLVGNTQGLLRLPTGKQINDISRMAEKELAIPMATGLQKIFGGVPELKYTNIRIPWQNAVRSVQMHILKVNGKKGQEPLAAVFIKDMPSPRPETSQGETQEFDLSREAEQRIGDLEQELQFTKENLQATIEELETSNEELQATNEELLASNEELQSTNEELQSVNEELHTVNTEYQTKILELTEMTNDLENFMATTRVATLFLDENQEIRKFTPELGRIYRILPGDIGRPISHLTHKLIGEDPVVAVHEVLLSGKLLEREVRTEDGGYFLMRAMPYQVGGPYPSGVVLIFVDVAQLRQVEADQKEIAQILETTQQLARVGSWRLNLRTRHLYWSNEIYHIFGLDPEHHQPNYETFVRSAPPEDRDQVRATFHQALEQGKHFDFVHRVARPDGSVRVVREKSEFKLDAQGIPSVLIGMVHDITGHDGTLCDACPITRGSLRIPESTDD